jgi:hypothetical protein
MAIDLARLVETADLPQLARQAGVDLKFRNRRWWGCCPFHSERTPSFTVSTEGHKPRFKCFGCGEAGDALDFIQAVWKLDRAGAIAQLGGEAHRPLPRKAARRRDPAQENAKRESRAARIWCAAAKGANDAVAAYLAGRGLIVDRLVHAAGRGLPPSIRSLDRLEFFAEVGRRVRVIATAPAMVCGVQNERGAVTAVHVTYLDPAGRKAEIVHPETGEIMPARKMIGSIGRGAVRLGPARKIMAVAEGIETSLSVHAALVDAGEGERVSVWAALSLQNIAGGGIGRGRPHPTRKGPNGETMQLPTVRPDTARPGVFLGPHCAEVWDFLDNDNKDPAAARALITRAHARWTAEGKRIRTFVPPAGMDFNDLARGKVA